MSGATEAVTLSVDGTLATLRISREHGNAINEAVVDGLASCAGRAASDDGVRGVLLAAAGKLFCPGLDLVELADLDRPAMRRFMLKFEACVLDLFTLPKPVVAAIHGHALAGGCVLALTADRRMARRGVLIGLNEIRVGVPLPYGVAQVLRESVQRARLEEIALIGRNYADEEAVAAGLAHEVLEEGGFEQRCLERLEEMASKDPAAFAATKRYLRSAAAERIRREDPGRVDEFLDAWFSAGTRARIGRIVADLRARGG